MIYTNLQQTTATVAYSLVPELRDLAHNGFWNDVDILLQKVERRLILGFLSES